MISSCAKEAEISNQPVVIESGETVGKFILGEKLENPYSVDNMKKAYASLSPDTRAEVGGLEIEPTHLYVRFSPATIEELDLLKLDSTLHLYPYPLDYEITEGEGDNIYVDFSTENGRPVPHYASVEIGKPLPGGIACEVLEKLFIPDDYSDDAVQILTRAGSALSESFVESLVDKAMEITGISDYQMIKTKFYETE